MTTTSPTTEGRKVWLEHDNLLRSAGMSCGEIPTTIKHGSRFYSIRRWESLTHDQRTAFAALNDYLEAHDTDDLDYGDAMLGRVTAWDTGELGALEGTDPTITTGRFGKISFWYGGHWPTTAAAKAKVRARLQQIMTPHVVPAAFCVSLTPRFLDAVYAINLWSLNRPHDGDDLTYAERIERRAIAQARQENED